MGDLVSKSLLVSFSIFVTPGSVIYTYSVLLYLPVLGLFNANSVTTAANCFVGLAIVHCQTAHLWGLQRLEAAAKGCDRQLEAGGGRVESLLEAHAGRLHSGRRLRCVQRLAEHW